MITLIQSPQTLSPAYNQNVWVFESTNVTKLGYRLILDIQDNLNNSIAKLKIAPEPNGNYLYVDIAKILSNQVSYDFNPDAILLDTNNSMFKYQLVISEEFIYEWDFTTVNNNGGFAELNSGLGTLYVIGDQILITNSTVSSYNGLYTVTSGASATFLINAPFNGTATGTVQYQNRTKITIADSTYGNQYVFNGAFSFADFRIYNETTYSIPQSPISTVRKMLTDMPNIITMTTDQDLWLNFFKRTSDNVNINARFQNSNGDIINQSAVWTSSFNSRISQFAAGPGNANPTLVSAGTLPLIKTNTLWYDVWLYSAGANQLTQKYRINIDQRCKNENYEIAFLDRLGSISSFAFQLNSTESINVERKQYNKFLGDVTNIGWDYRSYQQGQSIYNVNFGKELTLNTNWIDDNASVYFEQLFTSPATFIKMEDGLYYSVIIQDNGTTIERQKNKNLIKKSIKVKLQNEIINI